jgi:multisubunit Na+/H+ antiporter MnhG subunit
MSEQSKETSYVPLGLMLGLLPTVIALVLAKSASASTKDPSPGFYVVFLAISVACCFLSSSLLFRRKTVLAILAGVLFLILNSVVSLFLGCAVLLSGIR